MKNWFWADFDGPFIYWADFFSMFHHFLASMLRLLKLFSTCSTLVGLVGSLQGGAVTFACKSSWQDWQDWYILYSISVVDFHGWNQTDNSLAWLGKTYQQPFQQVLKGAVGGTLGQNEAEVKFHMEIGKHISSTEQAGKIRLTELSHQIKVICSYLKSQTYLSE